MKAIIKRISKKPIIEYGVKYPNDQNTSKLNPTI
jgi:hypothetical protein